MLEGSPAEEEEEQGRRHLTSNVYSEEREKRNERKNIFCLTFLTQGGIYETRFMLLSDGFYFPPSHLYSRLFKYPLGFKISPSAIEMNIDLNLTTFREYFIGLSLFSLSLLWLRGAPKICISAWNQTRRLREGNIFQVPKKKGKREKTTHLGCSFLALLLKHQNIGKKREEAFVSNPRFGRKFFSLDPRRLA